MIGVSTVIVPSLREGEDSSVEVETVKVVAIENLNLELFLSLVVSTSNVEECFLTELRIKLSFLSH